MISDSDDAILTAQADILVPVKRGVADRVALHTATLGALEAIALGLASCDSPRAISALGRLDDLRRSVLGPQAPAQPAARRGRQRRSAQ